MRHLLLTELESLIKKNLVLMTNQAYGRNIKFSYRMKWEKGTQKIEDGTGKTTKNYYALSLDLIDKTENIAGKVINLYMNFYPMVPAKSVEKLEEEAYKDLLLNGMHSLANVLYSNYLVRMDREVVKPEDIKLVPELEVLKEEIAKEKKIILNP